MANSTSNNKEKESVLVPSAEKVQQKPVQSREFLEASKNFIEGLSTIVESGETGEVAEFNEGNVAEISGEGRKKVSGGSFRGQSGALKKKKEEQPPSIEIMQIQVATKIEKEIRFLEKEMAKLISGSRANFSPHKLNDVVSRIRSLREILANMVYATAEAIKALWMKYVKGMG